MSNITKLLMLLGIGLLLAAASVYFIGGKKKIAGITTTINASPEQVFPYLVETDLKKQWLPSILDESLVPSLEDVQADQPAVLKEGAKILTTLQMGGVPIEMKGEVIRFQENELISVKSRGEEIVITYFFGLTEKSGATELDCRKIIRYNGMQRFTSVFEKDFGESAIKAALEQEVRRLAQLVESQVENLPAGDSDPAMDESESEAFSDSTGS